MKIGLIVAMDKEFELLSKILKNLTVKKIKHLVFVEGWINQNQVILMQSGIGKVCSATAAAEMINNFAPECIINTGVAGGLDQSLEVADIVVAQQTSYHDVWCGEGNEYGQVQGLPAKFDSDKTWLQKISDIKAHPKIYCGLIVSGDKFVDTPEELGKIKALFPNALAVDMESAAIAQVCYMYGVPFVALRIISDVPGRDKQAEQYKDFWQNAPKESLDIVKKLLD